MTYVENSLLPATDCPHAANQHSDSPPFDIRIFPTNDRCLSHISAVIEQLPGPNRAWLLRVYIVMPRPLLSLYGIIYVTWYASYLPEPTGVWLGSIWYTNDVTTVFTYQTPTSLIGVLHNRVQVY